MSNMREYVFKVIVVGNGAVGKTSMVLQYTERKFNDNYIMSIGSNFAIKILSFPEKNIHIRLQLWDLAGQQHFQFVRPSFYRGAFAKIIVFDITNRESFESLQNWIDESSEYIAEAPLLIVGNKIDLTDERVVSKKEGVAAAEKYGAVGYFESSAKSATNIDEIFQELTKILIEKNLVD